MFSNWFDHHAFGGTDELEPKLEISDSHRLHRWIQHFFDVRVRNFSRLPGRGTSHCRIERGPERSCRLRFCLVGSDHREDDRMKIGSSAARLPISNIVAKGTCPICAALKEFQNYFAKNLRASECIHFCNLHAWVIANSAPAELVAT